MKIIVDTNIIFSTLLNSNGTIGNIVFNSDEIFEFYSCSYMKYEIQKHWKRLLKISKLTDEELLVANFQVLSKLNFIDEAIINNEIWIKSEEICKDIDIDDTDFIALTNFMKGTLWTGDKVLYNGLKAKGFKKVVNTTELSIIRENKLKV